MIRPSLRRIAVLALFVALAVSGPSFAKPRATASPHSATVLKVVPAGFWDTVRSFLVSVWTKNGSAGDPYGNPSSGQGIPQPAADNGCSLDPYGQCLPGH